MKRNTRRILNFFLLLVWFVIILFPAFAVVLAARQQIQIGNDPQRYLRIFLVQEPSTRGVGIEWARPSGQNGDCAQTSLTYLLWRGEGENARFCSCYDGDRQFLGSSPGSCPP